MWNEIRNELRSIFVLGLTLFGIVMILLGVVLPLRGDEYKDTIVGIHFGILALCIASGLGTPKV